MDRGRLLEHSLAVIPLLDIIDATRERYVFGRQLSEPRPEVLDKVLDVEFGSFDDQLEDILEVVAADHRSRRLDCFDTHHLEFGFAVLDTLVIVDG